MKRRTGASWPQMLHAARQLARDQGLPQAMMAATAPHLIQRAVVEGRPDEGVMASGVVGGAITEIPTCRDLVERIAREARQRLESLSAPSDQARPAA
jgi:NAD(P)H-dependent flavin oxidoreductase YrpB (nitropropane dioxygenase family)